MLTPELIRYLSYFHGTTNIPIRLYYDSNQFHSIPTIPKDIDPFCKYEPQFLTTKKEITYLITEQSLIYGFLRLPGKENRVLILGPILHTHCSNENVMEIMRDADISLSHKDDFFDFFRQLEVTGFERFLQSLCLMYFTFYQQPIERQDILDYKDHRFLFQIDAKHTASIVDAKENQHFHNTYSFETQYLSIIENGDVDALIQLFEKPLVITPGIVADNNLRQIKNLFIASATLVTRTCIKGGMNVEEAYQLSDTYIQEMERLHSMELMYKLQYKMMLDFTERVAASKIPSGLSPLIFECLQFISKNTNKPIHVEDIASHFGKSRSFISKKFTEELGFGLNEYITRRKLEEAKSLLAFTDQSISEISNYLCFSSQSYMQNLFKKHFNITPNEYRKQKKTGY